MWTEFMRRWGRTGRPRRFAPWLESLDGRAVPAVVASFNPAAGTLAVIGDAADNAITVGRDAAGTILVNGGSIKVNGGTPTVAAVELVSVFGNGGHDALTLDEANGPLPAAEQVGGEGNDTLTGGSGGDTLLGDPGNDLLDGGIGDNIVIQ